MNGSEILQGEAFPRPYWLQVVVGLRAAPGVVTGLLIWSVLGGHSQAVICGVCGSFVVLIIAVCRDVLTVCV